MGLTLRRFASFMRSSGKWRLALLLLVVAVAGATAAGAAPSVRGTIRFESFHSAALAGTVHYSVYLPPGYATSGKRYPVIYFLHGLPAGGTTYQSIAQLAAAVEATGKPAIVIGAQGARAGDTDPEWRNWGAGRNWETATAKELVSVVDSRYRTIAARSGRLLVGISAGGYGATLIALHNPGIYSVVESWSGYFQPTDPTGTKTLNLGADTDVHQVLPTVRAALRSTKTFIAFYVGRSDWRFFAENETFNQELSENGVAHVFRAYPGGHDQVLWQRYAAPWVELALVHLAPAH